MNRLFFHVNTHNPWLDRKPGMTLDGIGLFFQRDQTWFAEAKPFVDYITRCQTLLQKGRHVVDIAVYTGEDIPSRALTPDRLVPMLPGLFGAKRVLSERRRLANVGQPMEESPAGVRHSAGIIDLKDWINALHGYQYDSMNKDALMNQPFNYKVLVIPEGAMVSKEVKTKIEQLRRKGVLIVDKPWREKTFRDIEPDVTFWPETIDDKEPLEGIAYTHRKADGKDIYFFSNQNDRFVNMSATLRAAGSRPMRYDPISDMTMPVISCHSDGKHTTINESMLPYQSFFIILDEKGEMSTISDLLSSSGIHIPGRAYMEDQLWDIHFRESGITLKKQRLFDWSQHEDDRIRYFSGHARYTTILEWKGKPDEKVSIQLPNVHDIAHVWVNGIDCGIAWTAPYTVDISGTLKKGKNTIEIEVVNTWHNALRGMDQGKAPYDGIWTNAKYRTKGDGLLPAGLLEQPYLITSK